MKIRAPAKINLSLRVVGRRADGYHLVDSIMVPVSLYDELDIRRVNLFGRARAGPSLRVSCDHPLVPDGKKNLVYQAVSCLLQEAGVAQPLAVNIRKRIPVGAGLGGGSTDAAAALVGVNRLLKLRFSKNRLEKLGSSLGADVPFFIRGRAVRARGIGDRLSPVKKIGPRWLVILYPGFPVSTAWAYRNLRRNLTKYPANTSINSSITSASKSAQLLINDLEAVVIKRYPRVGLLKDELIRGGADRAMMTGSGSAVFGVFRSRERAGKAYRSLCGKRKIQAFLARVVSSPNRLP